MPTPTNSRLLTSRLRTSPGVDLVALGELSGVERTAVLEQDPEDDVWGVLRSRENGAVLRSVSADLALLLLTLGSPSPLPRYAARDLGDAAESTVRRLVMDELLEVEHDGTFVSGGAATEFLGTRRTALGSGRIGALTRAALAYGQELTDLVPWALALRLYGFATYPVTPSERRRMQDDAVLAVACGTQPGSPAARALATAWTPTSTTGSSHWSGWRARGAVNEPARYKLYVSPTPEALPDAVAAVAIGLADVDGAVAFKVGRGAGGVRRPDKLVAYFRSLEALHAGAGAVQTMIDGYPAHGVPFTAALSPDGLLSWGMDPPAGPAIGTSWRMWVAHRLAEHLLVAARAPFGETPPAQVAVERLGLDGVDTERWVPTAAMYEEST